MRLFDPHIHMTSRTTDDYQAMVRAGIVAVLEPAFWLGQPRTHVGSVEDYFASLIGWERFRASQLGVRHFCALALNPKEANDPELAPGVMELLPEYLPKETVVAVGEIGFDEMTRAEEKYLELQLALAVEHGLPALVHTPHRDKKRGTQRTLAMVRAVGIAPERVLMDHNTEETLPMVLEAGCWAGHSIYPETKMDEARMATLVAMYGPERILVNSAADWGISDPLKVPKTVAQMRQQGVSDDDIEKVVWHNPIAFFGQSGKLDVSMLEAQPGATGPATYLGNGILRGERDRGAAE